MRIITAEKVRKTVAELCRKANFHLRADVLSALRKAAAAEVNPRSKMIMRAILENASQARQRSLAICQDTGMPVVFVRIGQEVHLKGNFAAAVNKGVEEGYRSASLRNSIVKYPLARGSSGFSPAVIHSECVPGSFLEITVLPKGFGCENKSQLKMFMPTASREQVIQFIVECVKAAGPDACPPYVVGVGIGGTADLACTLAKKALLKDLSAPATALEKALLSRINALKIGPMGLGGRTTVLAVKVQEYPTHIAGMPVAFNISCLALRSATARV
jgi:fumarate hydratase subunit alpha